METQSDYSDFHWAANNVMALCAITHMATGVERSIDEVKNLCELGGFYFVKITTSEYLIEKEKWIRQELETENYVRGSGTNYWFFKHQEHATIFKLKFG